MPEKVQGEVVSGRMSELVCKGHLMDSTSVSLLQRLRQSDQEAACQRFVDLYAPLIFHWGKNQGLTPIDSTDLLPHDPIKCLKSKEFSWSHARAMCVKRRLS